MRDAVQSPTPSEAPTVADRSRLRLVPPPGPIRSTVLPAPTRADRACRAILTKALARLAGGRVTVIEQNRRTVFGDDVRARDEREPLEATVVVNHPGVFRRILTQGSVGLGESYADGWWDVDDLAAFVRILDRTVRPVDPVLRRAQRFTAPLAGPIRRMRREDADRDRADIHAHYDIGNDFFELLLDETMMYSSAIFPAPTSSLADASTYKLDELCTRIGLGPNDHVLEIGTGWGGFAVYAAENHGCRVVTTTISREQYEYASQRVLDAGLEDRVTVLERDYRDLRGTFDAIVSIEMIEAVDWREYNTFFRACERRLAPNGRIGIQAIVIPGQRFEQAKTRQDFIKHVIFPGGCLPSIEAMLTAVGAVTDLTLVDLEDIGPHYAETLRRWHANLHIASPQLADLGLDERFERLWSFYLSYCEAGFDERTISAVQLVLARPTWSPAPVTPPSRHLAL
jgi:cyclopropane-fatty-acyl-phospholipid synthase